LQIINSLSFLSLKNSNELKHRIHQQSEKNHWWFKSRRSILKCILGQINHPNKKTVLEVGCGTGGNLKYLFNNFNKVNGMDNDSTALDYAKVNFCAGGLFQGDANSLNNLESSYNLIAFLDVLYHDNIKSVEDVIKQANNRLKSNGYLLLSEPAFNFLKGKHSETVQTKRRFTKHKLEKIIYRSGFKKIIISSYWGFTIFFLMLMKRRILEPIFGTNINSEGTDLFSIPIVDDILFWLTKFESKLIKEMNIPFGSSVVILAKK